MAGGEYGFFLLPGSDCMTYKTSFPLCGQRGTYQALGVTPACDSIKELV
jgi:hypothetical protein